ncbi:helix-turn-helix domain-containing protein [Patulibacter brassicae]|uniref:Helix-turn-helix domain-containing protein n=1 Tax=Patulibacter brassicae TaxID=1705717 RepID=A0ABU4VLD3_9ACTN|nr:helix-turn-helix domain-containing protein [Patulibacter brassicae]MDX8151741.1 helix-turn-helix domain-containing protein [Patulibacter brassicae]
MAGRSAERAEALVRRVAEEADGDRDELVGLILERLRAGLPEFFADADVARDMAAAVAANVARLHQLLAEPAPRSAALPIEAEDLLQSTIQHGIPLISLLEAYRAAQGVATDWWQARLAAIAPPALLPAATRRLQARIVTYIDVAAVGIRASYERERRAHETSPDGRRAHLVRRLLAGERIDPDAAARTLNHPLTGRHVALVLWRARESAAPDALDVALERIGAALAPARVLRTTTRHRAYAWCSTHGELDPARAADVACPAGVGVAMSARHDGVAGFVRAHGEALRTAELVREAGLAGDGRIALHERFELVALLAREPDDAARFVARVLGPLAEDRTAAARTRGTLRAYLAAGSSRSRAAERLGVHRNTVASRLAAVGLLVEELDAAVDPARRLEVELALHVVAQLGPVERTAAGGVAFRRRR